ncbi:MAG: carboxypeptidase regulatory-like domain-containing protein [Kofleriaceae bacterium]
MRIKGPLLITLLAACASSKPHDKQSNGKFEDCYYDCKPGQGGSAASTPASPPTVDPAKPAGKVTAVSEKAHDLREAADKLEKAQASLDSGNKNLADQLFSQAELITGPEALAALAGPFREGAPPRVNTPTEKVEKGSPQPKTVGSSEQEDAEAKVAPPKVEGSLTGTVEIDGKPLTGAFGLVTLEPVTGKWAARTPKRRAIEQRDRTFLPHVMAVPVGSTISFPNFDGVFHNVFSTSPLAPFDLGIYKQGEAREFTFAKEGIVRLGCNLHANMSAYIAVVSAPAYVITDDAGKFSFKHLAPGKYHLKAWSERSKAPVTQDVTIKVGGNDVKVGVDGQGSTGPAPDKFGGKRG